MDLSLERDSSSALGSLFQQIINDLKNTSPLWEDFVTKATKLHQCLRAAIQAIAAYLDAFQKIADAATNSRGASKEIGTALTRVCLRHKAVESRLKTFTTAIMDCLVQPLQEKLEDWKRTVITIDKEHAKEYKRCRTELKKRSSDTLRLQKKARKGQSDTIQSLMDSHKQDVTLRRAELEEVEKKSLRSAMIEERLRYCTFVHMLQPVVKEECEVMSELGHLQEAMDSIALVTKEPSVLPQASEELIHDTKATMSLYPESPGGGSSSQGGCSNSLGSRKSSVCSISSMNSSGSSNSPGHHHYPRSLSQLISPAIRLKPGESSDSGFCSSPALTTQATTATSQSHAVSTWPPHSQDAVPVLPPASDRPHTISTAYEKGHQRPPLTVYTFQNPETILEGSGGSGSGSIPGTPNGTNGGAGSGANTPSTQKSPAGALSRPPLPVRCSSLERPLSANNNRSTNNLLQRQCPSPIPAHITKELSAHHAQQQHMQQQQQLQQHLQTTSPPPTYVNMSELANMAAAKITNQQQQQQQQRPVANLQQQHSIDSISSQFSNDSTASGYQQSQQQQSQHQSGVMVSGNNSSSGSKTRSHSVSSSSASSNTPSLHSHPSIESGTIATPLVGQTPTPSSGSSTPQNHYSPLLTNSPSSTAAGTPSGGSVTSGMLSGFVYNVNSPTPPQSGTASVDSDVLKITETDGAGQQPTIVPAQEINTQQQQTSNTTNNNAMNSATCIESQITPTETSDQTYSNATDSNATTNDTESPTIVENDERSRASVLQKASMFEKQAAAAAAAASTAAVTPARSTVEAIYGTRRTPDEVYRTANTSAAGNHYQQLSPHQQQQQQQQHVEQQEVGGVTRIARRSSVNTAKPPPPVRRSSSVTPSHNATGTAATQSPQQIQQQPQHYQHPQQLHHLHSHGNQQLPLATTTTIQNSHYDTVDGLPPPPAYLLDSRQAQSSTPTPPPPSAVSSSAIPSSSLKVAETVKALSAMRHKPASPNAIRHMQQQQHQQQQLQQSHQSLQYSPTPSSPSPIPTPIQLQQNIYSTTVKTFSSTALLPPDCNTEQTLHYDAYSYYNPYMEVSRTTTPLTSAKMPLTNVNHANAVANEAAYQTLPITPTPIYYYDAVTMQPTTTIATTPTKSQHLQSNALPDTYGVHTTLRSTPTKTNNPPVSPSYTSPPPYDFQHSKIELPPPLPPPNPNQQRSLKQQQQQQQQQQKQFADHQYHTQATSSTPHPTQYQHTNNNNQFQQKRQHEQIYDYLPSHQHLHHSPKLQHKPPQQQSSQIQQQQQQLAHHLDALMIDNDDEANVFSDNASFRTSSPGIYAQPKIVTSMSSFRSGSPAPTNDHHNQHHHVIPPTQPKTNPNLIAQLSARLSKQNQQQHTSDGIYGSTPNSPNHHNMHQQQQQQQQHQHQHHQSEPVYMRNYTHPHHQQHQPPQQQMSSVAAGSMHQQQNYDAAQTPKHQSSYAPAGGVARQQQLQQQQQQHHPHHREPHTHSCPPPLENPPPPPTNSSIYAATANANATMPKNAMRSNAGATYAPPTATMTLPKNLAQQRLQQQQHYQQQQQHYQQQQYQQSTAIGANAAAQQHHQSQQHSQTATGNQRAQMPLPHQQQQQMSYKQKSATLQSNHRQPPIPSRHSSVQQKIFVATNPFIQTTTIHCHSPASVHSQPASPTCSSPSSLASIYGTSSRSHHHHHHQQQQQQQQQHHSSGSGSGIGGGAAGNGYYAASHNPTSYASSNIEKAGSIRSKTKAEFLENLNAKLAKQGLSGRAFAVRNLINSKALMYQNPQTLMRPSAQYCAQPQSQAPPTPPTSSAEESSTH
ncbi:PREDICTED: AF4/FMR2 family member 4 isoform X16 [Bactrocera latifrons]|uniref:AF4/FMR2 family member 4 isoform X16 n=1 Tax=Bactrocera latifrons TaxID=174628 RepID=UPI0008DCD989|nr:PREDICTED: AF4/FMR2 family member 4 isoform X16 [Bactrocera latifrons]